MEFIDDWRDRAEMARPFVFDRVVIADRSASMLAYNYARYQRTASVPYALPGSVNWWMTIRNNAIQFTGLKADVGGGTTTNPVITYISRQSWGRRMLIQADHEKLVRELYKLRDNYGYEVNVVSMDKLSRIQQLQLAARTTVSDLSLIFIAGTYPECVCVCLDHDGCSWQWSDLAHLDETFPAIHRHGVFLPWRIRPRLRIHNSGSRDDPLRILGFQVR
jgi:hypothetical protein